jgi:hypothetical protein
MSNSHSSNISIITTIFVEQPLLLFNALQHMPNHLFLNICPMHYIQKILCAPHMLHLCPMQLFHHSTTCSKSKQQCPMLPTTFPHAKIRKPPMPLCLCPTLLSICPTLSIITITHQKGYNPASPLVHIFIVDACFQDILQET